MRRRSPSSPGSVGLAFSEDADFDELDDLGRRAGRDRFGRRVRSAPLSTGRQRALALVVALVVIAIGTRDLFFGTLPLVGQLAPLPSWSTSWHHFFSGWQSSGVGTTAPASPAFGLVGLTGTVFFGAMGTLQRVLLLGCIPLGAWGVSRCLRPLVSPRPVSWRSSATSGSRCPTARSARAAGTAWWPTPRSPSSRCAWPAPPAWLPTPSSPGRAGGSRPAGQVVLLGAVIAAASAFAPAVLPDGARHGGGLGAGLGPRGRAMSRPGACSSWRCRRWSWRWSWPCPGWSGPRWRARGRWPSSAFPSPAPRRRAGAMSSASPSGPAARSPLAWLLVLGCGAAARHRPRHQAGLGGAPVGDWRWPPGASPTPPATATSGPSRLPRPWCWRRLRSRWRCASASGSPPSRTT